MNRTQIVGDFADRLGVEDAMFEQWRDAHLQQDFYGHYGLHILCDTRWNNFAVYFQDATGECKFVHCNFAL